jgi:hypothetical protein
MDSQLRNFLLVATLAAAAATPAFGQAVVPTAGAAAKGAASAAPFRISPGCGSTQIPDTSRWHRVPLR